MGRFLPDLKHKIMTEEKALNAVEKAINLAYDKGKKLPIQNVSGSASDFEKDLGKLINDYVKAGIKKPDLVKKMEWMTGNCKFS